MALAARYAPSVALPEPLPKPTLLGDAEAAADRVREAEADLTAARAELVEKIRTARDEGIPFSLIARRIGLSRERVRQLYLGASIWLTIVGPDKLSRRVLSATMILY
jgi:hypothetical protein